MIVYCSVRLHQRSTPQGLREWLAFDDASGTFQAELCLLPDSDFLAWDQMCADPGLEWGASSDHDLPRDARFLRRSFARLGIALRRACCSSNCARNPASACSMHTRRCEFRYWLSISRAASLGTSMSNGYRHGANLEGAVGARLNVISWSEKHSASVPLDQRKAEAGIPGAMVVVDQALTIAVEDLYMAAQRRCDRKRPVELHRAMTAIAAMQ